ncbi:MULTISPECIES: hypothetical protein [Pseudomonas]|uniref:hypothetical protein n=1 Tax=Pseudomonas TaxID=286 RepID=UPI0018C884B8|nr:hypothetical protein [Pseudomonas tolaasii]MBY8943422.1 hypothetical protein [Pseudomonas tolaasii]
MQRIDHAPTADDLVANVATPNARYSPAPCNFTLNTEFCSMTIAQSFSTSAAQVMRSQVIVEHILEGIRSAVGWHAITPGPAVVLVGEDMASRVYVRNKTS